MIRLNFTHSLQIVAMVTGALSLFTTPQLSANEQSPSHVFQMATQLQNEMIALREAEGVTEKPTEPAVQTNKKPIHVYAKGVEVRNKIIRLQKKYGIPSLAPIGLPDFAATPTHVFQIVEPLTRAVKEINEAKGNTAKIAPFIPGKSPSNVYRKLWQVSYLFNGLIPPINPNLVYRNAQQSVLELENILSEYNVPIPAEQMPNLKGIKLTPYDVNVEAFKNMYRLAALSRVIDMPPSYASDFPIGKITPSEAFDTSNAILVEITRVKLALDISKKIPVIGIPSGKKPADVLIQMRRVGQLINALTNSIKQ
ncbi:MAG: hypothetical protein GXO35_03450 [Gammaproteobacteria bacterium]|nr:hypothetical protein [Gammaproteobacteria bacterium]